MQHQNTPIRRRVRLTAPTSAKLYSLTETGTGTEYKVSADISTGKVSCTCPAFKYSGGKGCKHCIKLLACLLEKSRRGNLVLPEAEVLVAA